jgi:hypothetical protein
VAIYAYNAQKQSSTGIERAVFRDLTTVILLKRAVGVALRHGTTDEDISLRVPVSASTAPPRRVPLKADTELLVKVVKATVKVHKLPET